MSKAKILTDQILNIANGLHTDTLLDIIESLSDLEEAKSTAILKSITAQELEEVYDLYQELCETVDVCVPIHLSCYVKLGGEVDLDVDSPPYTITADSDGYQGSFHLRSHINESTLLSIPNVKIAYNDLKKKNLKFKSLLKTLEDKYKINSKTILSHIMNENE